MSSRKIGPRRLLLSDLTMKKTTTVKLLLIYLICIHILGYKIKSLSLLRRNLHKIRREHAVSSPSVADAHSLRICRGVFC